MELLLIDATGIAHRAKHTVGDLTGYSQEPTGVIYGFMNQMLALSKKFNNNQFVFCWDSRESIRREMYPDYKKPRYTKPMTEEEKVSYQEAYKQMNLLRTNVLPTIGFSRQYMEEGFEADDLIASAVYTNPQHQFTIVSNDNDLYQLLGDNARMFDPLKKSFHTESNFIADFHIAPNKWAEVKAIAGCKTDNVLGIKGVGEKTAIKYLKGQIRWHLNSYKKIEAQKDLIEENLKLVRLPLEGTPQVSISNSKDSISLSQFMFMCNRFNFQGFLKKPRLFEWRQYMEME